MFVVILRHGIGGCYVARGRGVSRSAVLLFYSCLASCWVYLLLLFKKKIMLLVSPAMSDLRIPAGFFLSFTYKIKFVLPMNLPI